MSGEAPPAADERWMRRALALAERGRATSHPNPRVGCIVVRDGAVVGEGWHRRAGEPHAEVIALRAAGDRARGATAYVSLEPCVHFGRTPPCVDALIAAGVSRVVAAMEDPDPRVSGRGAAALRAAGVEVQLGVLAEEAAVLNRGYVSRHRRGRPWLTLKLAASLDGRTASADGESRWITGEAARRDVHRLRAEAGAVLTSSATVIADDPQLNVRAWDGDRQPPRQPDRVVIDMRGRLAPTARVFAPGARRVLAVAPALAAAAAVRFADSGVEILATETDRDGGAMLPEMLRRLAALAINEVLVECGPCLAGAWIAAECVDELVVYLAPKLLGDSANPLVRLTPPPRLAQAPVFDLRECRPIGTDLRLTLAPAATQRREG